MQQSMTEKKITFPVRITRMEEVARCLDNAHTIVVDELDAMRAAAARFEKRTAERPKARQ